MSNHSNCSQSPSHCIGLACGALLLRLWIGMRLLFAGLEKWKTKTIVKIPDVKGQEEAAAAAEKAGTNVAEAVAAVEPIEKSIWVYDVFGKIEPDTYSEKMKIISSNMDKDSPLALWMIEQYSAMLGWMLLIVGAWVLIGLASRTALVVAGFVFISLTFGLATIGADPEVIERGIEVGLVVGALALARYQVFGVDGLIRLAMGGKSGSSDDDSKRQKD